MDASDVTYAAQIDRKEAQLLDARKRARSVAARRPSRAGSSTNVLMAATSVSAAPPPPPPPLQQHEPVWETNLFACWDASFWHCCLAAALPCAIASHAEATVDRGSLGAGAFFLGLTFIGAVACALQSIDMVLRDGDVAHEDQPWTTQYRSELLHLNMWGVAACAAAAMYAAGVFAFRNMTRHYYHIPGSCCADAAVAAACAPCAMAQISRHFEIAGPSVYATTAGNTSALTPVDTIPAYQELC